MDVNHAGYGTSQLPLAGAILCCTSIAPEQRAQLAAIGAQMGATIKLDLTSDVTHLIVGSTDSPKYRYVAKSRDDVKVLSPEWLEALREVWMTGDDNLDVLALEKDYRMPTFSGLKICLTGFDNPDQRKSIQDKVDANGGEYHGDLTKSVTHLIAATPSGKKYEHALNWGMKIVALEWLEQSLERGMVLEETYYNPTLPVEERGKGAWERRQPASPAPSKRPRDTEGSQALNPFRRKLRRSASTRLGSQSEALWAGITAPSFEKQVDEDGWTEDTLAKQDTTRPSTGTHTPSSPRPSSVHQDDVLADFNNADPVEDPNASIPPQADSPSQHDGIFQGRIVCPHGFDTEKTRILRQHLESNGARVLSASDLDSSSIEDLERGYFIVPHDVEVDLTTLPDRAGSHIPLVTNWWVERCLYGKRLVDPAEDVLSRPFESRTISGATYDEQLSAKTSVVVCNPPTINTPKLKFATDKRIPAVHAKWLWACLRTGRLQSYAEYQLNKPPPPQKLKQAPRPQDKASTLSISEEQSTKVRQGNQHSAKAVTKPPRQQRPGTLDLALPTDSTPTSTKASVSRHGADDSNLSYNEDGFIVPGIDGSASLPLRETNANTPRRLSTSSNTSKPVSRARSSSAESLIAPARKSKSSRVPTPDSVIPDVDPDSVIPEDAEAADPMLPHEAPKEKGPVDEKDYSSILAQMRANRKAAPAPADPATSKTRKRRQLGRAASTRSNASAGDSSGNLLVDDEEENTVLVEEYQASQTLAWESPGAAKAREQMIRKLGGTVKETSVAVEGIGVVKDAGGEVTTTRTGRKRRG
ncbi:subunit of DNA polymerase II [Pyrenophora tritici-repentis Pt-1C-BFP]|uniref:Subunit of DNA polymerase II n=1 Tax=Pyrenophora tritici-repentis (strain Pt-1C-BFP) TaxID=426418 RepID=B2W7P6_PYRTR|nr:subunit of DNA polymerase II [Pyrenophora tritici-repentis Pt-1C-BFP]EDU48754.1 subunit of DNA polymerase II [Pyrenophora tritici-repentis Pt-1C-BFP]